MSGWKKIKKMIEEKNFGDVKIKELENYLQIEGYRLEQGGKHTRIVTHDGKYLSTISRQRTIRKDQLKSILKQIGRF